MPSLHESEVLDPNQKCIAVLANRAAGQGGDSRVRLDRLISALRAAGYEIHLDFDRQAFLDRVHALRTERGIRCVVAAGGDGTAEFVANAISPDVPLMVFPLGTENLLARYLQIPCDAEKAARIILEGHLVRFDAGRFGDRLFLIMLSCGFDADVVHRMHGGRSGNITRLAYAKPILDSIRSYQYPPVRISCWESSGAAEIINTAHWVFVFNVPSYAMGLDICSEALPNDGMLDVAIFSGGSFWSGLYHLGNIVLHRHKSQPGFRLIRASRIRIEAESNGERVPFQVDGDPGGFLPVDINASKHHLAMVVPKLWLMQRTKSCQAQRS
jgi:diacylglycerol kinase family enzyme